MHAEQTGISLITSFSSFRDSIQCSLYKSSSKSQETSLTESESWNLLSSDNPTHQKVDRFLLTGLAKCQNGRKLLNDKIFHDLNFLPQTSRAFASGILKSCSNFSLFYSFGFRSRQVLRFNFNNLSGNLQTSLLSAKLKVKPEWFHKNRYDLNVKIE